MIVCDEGRADTFENIEHWIEQIHQQSNIKDPSIMVLANKRDLNTKKITASMKEDF